MAQKRRVKGEGSIFERKDGSWMFEFALGRDADGKRVKRTMYARTRAELLRWISDERARGGGTIQPRAIGIFGEWVDAWLADEVKPNLPPSTYESDEAVWAIHVKPTLGHVEMDSLGVDHVLHLMRRLRAAGVSASMVSRALRVMHRAVEVAIRQGRFHRPNPFARVDRPKVESSERRSLLIEEARRLIAAPGNDRYESLGCCS